MSELTERGKVFRASIAGFIEARRNIKLKGKEDDADAASKYDYAIWLADAASRAHNLQVVTHPIKFTHSGIKGASSIHVDATRSAKRNEISTHSVAILEEDFAITDAKHLDVYSFLKEIVDGKRLLDWFREDDADLITSLSGDPATAATLATAFKQVFRAPGKATSHSLAKQVYWLSNDVSPSDDDGYQLLQPLFSSSLEHAVHGDIRSVRETAFAARGTRKQKPTFADHSSYPSLVARTIGGSNAQNVSPQNKARGGVNYLLASLPPPAWRPREGTNLRNVDSVFADKHSPLIFYGEVRPLIRELADFLKTNPDANVVTRNKVSDLLQKIALELALFGAEVRGRHEPGWTRADPRDPPTCEQLWLDPERTELAPRNDLDHPQWHEDDLDFISTYERGDWADEVATRFARWLNQQLRDRSDKLATLGDAEMRHFARQAVLEVAWPTPLQRRTKAGAA